MPGLPPEDQPHEPGADVLALVAAGPPGPDNPVTVAAVFWTAVTEPDGPDLDILSVIVTPESWPSWGAFGAPAALLRGYGMAPEALPSAGDPDVVYVTYLRDPGEVTGPPADMVLVEDVVVATLVRRPRLGGLAGARAGPRRSARAGAARRVAAQRTPESVGPPRYVDRPDDNGRELVVASKLNPYLGFAGNAREAAEFYREVLGGELVVNTFGEAGGAAPGDEDKVMHAQLETPAGYTLMLSDAPAGMPLRTGSSISISLSGDDADELRGYFGKLAEGGSVSVPLEKQMWGDEFGMCTDRFGIEWMVNISGTAG